MIGLRAEVAPTPRLHHLGLHAAAGVTAPADARTLTELAAAGQLSTLVDDVIVAVCLSVQGQNRLGIASTIAVTSQNEPPEHHCRSRSGSDAGSAGRSQDGDGSLIDSAQEDAQIGSDHPATSRITWNVRKDHERINHDPSPDSPTGYGGGRADVRSVSGITGNEQCDFQGANCDQQPCLSGQADCPPAALAASVIRGHHELNPDRPLAAGEWHELLELQQTYGAEQLLIWQSRASRVRSERPYGITPAYYQACAARAALDAYRPRRDVHAHDARANPRVTPPLSPDPACDALLVAMGVRERQKLGTVPYTLIASWQDALAHPGMAAQFTSPIGFAVAQMQHGHPPPSTAELDRWAEHTRRENDRYESWRFIEPVLASTTPLTDEQELEARVRALAPPNADLEDLCALAYALEAGASAAEALAQLPSKVSVTILECEAHSCARYE